LVTAGKVFKLRDPMPLPEVAARLKGYRRETPLEDGGEQTLVTEIRDLSMSSARLEGTLSRDVPIAFNRRGEAVRAVKTMETFFLFTERSRQVYLLVVEKKQAANFAANLLSEILFLAVGGIVEARVPPDVLRRFHERSSEGGKVLFFDDVDIPNINRLALYGSTLANTSLYGEYLLHGKIWYVVAASRKRSIVVGITRDGVVVVFSRIELPDFVEYVLEEVMEMVE